MPRGRRNFSDMVLKDGVVAGFRLGRPKTFSVDIKVNDPAKGMIVNVPHTKVLLNFTLDASTIKPSDYASENPDPSKPLQVSVHTFIRDGVPLANAPADDMDRLNFVTYDTVKQILERSGYDPDAEDRGELKYPLKGLNYIQMSLGEGRTQNFIALRDNKPIIGGEDLLEEIQKARKETTGALRSILGMAKPRDEGEKQAGVGNLMNLAKPRQETSAEEHEMAREEGKRTKNR